ncbi:GNAT family N-acetyltransferase [bacterium]|nr:GNAT family N-acetyltransferase [bacterium]
MTGKLVRLRPFQDLEELATLTQVLNTEDQFWGSSWWPLAQMRQGFEQHAMLDDSCWFSFAAIDRLDTPELIGYEVIQLPKPGQLSAEIGTGILKQHWHNGFGREAKQLALKLLFENYALECITATTLVHHRRAIAGLDAIGMRREGSIRRSFFTGGKYADKVKYIITRQEWQRMQSENESRRPEA